MTQKERYEAVRQWFDENMPNPATELEFDSVFHLLLAVILSAQCTDKRVNQYAPALFAAYPEPADLAKATEDEVYPYIKSITFPNNKSRAIIKAARMLVEEFNGQVPGDIDSLMRLPGVGRKTANVMLAVVWGAAAMPVDTHVFRVSNRLGLTRNSKTPLQTEQLLRKGFPEDVLARAHHWLVLHGRYVCKARKPDCDACGLQTCCVFFSKNRKGGMS